MLSRGSARLCSVLCSERLHRVPLESWLPYRLVHLSKNIRDPFPSGQPSGFRGSQNVSLSHPLDPSNSTPPSLSSSSTSDRSVDSGPDSSPSSSNSQPKKHTPNNANTQGFLEGNSGVPSPYVYPTPQPSYTNPPFDTHGFFKALEKTFPTPTAQSLMRATRALLVDRLGKVRRDALTVKDLDNQAYLFRAALSELRAELSMDIKNESASLNSTMAALRRDVERLDVKMKEDIAHLRHESVC